MESRWTYLPWEEVLPGRTVRLLPGLKKTYAALREEPSPSAAKRALLAPGDERRAELVQGDWLRDFPRRRRHRLAALAR